MDRVDLASRAGAASEEEAVGFSVTVGHGLVDDFVKQEGVVVVHACWVGSVVILDVSVGDTLGEVGFERVNAHVHEALEVVREPCAGGRVREVYNGHTCLPVVPLPNRTVGALWFVSMRSR